jgi:hypothetical protein
MGLGFHWRRMAGEITRGSFFGIMNTEKGPLQMTNSTQPKKPTRRRNAAGHRAASRAVGLQALLMVYDQHFRAGRDQELARYDPRSTSFDEALIMAARARIPAGPNKAFRKEPHQIRIAPADLMAGYRALKSRPAPTWRNPNFASLLAETTQVANQTPGLGDLWAFDTALRLAIFFRCKPTDLHLHAGCRTGAERLLGRRLGQTVPLSSFGWLRDRLGAPHLESFLCTLKDYLHPALLSQERAQVA